MAISAMSPSVTGILTPVSLPPSTLAWIWPSVSTPARSTVAKQPMTSPAAIFGSHWLFCASLPASISASAAK